jgi:tetratricopeptide (TPR) repeat protein
MRRLLAIAIVAAALAGCAGQQDYDMAMRLYQVRQYDEALQHVQTAVRNDPENARYRELLTKIRQDAARAEYQRGLQFYEKRQLDLALVAFEKARTYNPEFTEAATAYDTVKQRRDLIQAVVKDIPTFIASGKPDEALAKIDEIGQFAANFPELPNLKMQALAASTVAHAKQGIVHMQAGRFEDARKEFIIALHRTPNYRPAAEGLAAAEAQMEAARLEEAFALLQQALKVVPGHAGARAAMVDLTSEWARALYDQGRALEEAGGFDDLAEALRKYERASALTERFADVAQRIANIRSQLTAEFMRRAQQYEQLGPEYLGLALINYRMALHTDESLVEVSRRIAQMDRAYDGRRAFYIDIRPADTTSAGASFTRQLAQQLKEAALMSGIENLYVLASYDGTAGASAPSPGSPGRRLVIFTSLLKEDVTTTGENKPETVRSRYRVGTRFAPNPVFQEARRALAQAQAQETEVQQDYEDALARLRQADTPEEADAAEADVDFERRRWYDAQDNVTVAQKALAETPEDVEQEVYQPYDYLVFSVTMDAQVEVSLEVADPESGVVRKLRVIGGEAAANDRYTEAVSATDAENAKPDPKELPTSSELLASARKDAAGKAVGWLKETLAQLSIRYYQDAKELEEIGNTEGAAELFYAFYLSTPDKQSPEAKEAIAFIREHTHLITPEEVAPLRPQ